MNSDTIFILCLILLGLLVLINRAYPEPFRLFLQLPFNDTFIRLYDSKLRSWRLTLWGGLAAGIFGLSYLIQELLSTQKINQSLNFRLYLIILSVLLLKQAIRFNSGVYLFKKKKAAKLTGKIALSFLAYQGLITYFFSWSYLAQILPKSFLEPLYIIVLLALQILSYRNLIKKARQGKFRFGMAFILYLCTFEMAPLAVFLSMVIK